ncbi:MAG: glycosyltransferase [Elusimicrobiota bacterium]
MTPLTYLILGQGLLQLAVCGLLAWRIFRDRRLPPPKRPPKVSVVVPCKGNIDTRNISRMLQQDYKGAVEFLFVSPSEQDPAFRSIRAFLAEGEETRARMLSSGAVPKRCGEAMLNCIHGAENASQDSEVLVYTDADLRVPPDWVSRLIQALEEPGVGVASAFMTNTPEPGSPWSYFRTLWCGLMSPLFNLRPGVYGHSYAIRRADFQAWDIAGLWSRVITTDAPMTPVVKAHGKTIRYAPLAAPAHAGPCDAESFFRVFGKWAFYVKLYAWPDWLVSLAAVSGKLALYVLAAFSQHPALNLGALCLGDMFYGLCCLRGISCALLTPLLWPLYLTSLLSAVGRKDILWGGYAYRIRGPFDIEVLRT